MPKQERNKTKYPGVFWVKGTGSNGKPERIYYITYRKNGRLIEEKAGRQYRDNMTPAKANRVRGARMRGEEPSNKERREAARREKGKIRWTVERIWQAYLNEGRNAKSRVQDENRYKNYLKEPFGDKLPSQIAPLDISRVGSRMKKVKKSPQTIKLTLELLRRIINYGVEKQLCDPLKFKIKMPRVENEKTEDLTPAQLQALLKAIKEDPHPDVGKMLLLALYTGMRRGEIFKLKWADVDFKGGFIKIRDPKGKKPQKIPLNEGARKVLESIYQGENEYVFPGRKGGQRVDVHHQANRIKQKAGLPENFRIFHGLRHVYASMLASSGQVDLYTLQKLLTHKSPKMTARYAHLRDGALKRAGKVANEIIQGAITENAKVVHLKR